MATSAAEISALGGPYPVVGESKAAYYSRVSSWAASTGFRINYDGAGNIIVGTPGGVPLGLISGTGTVTPAGVVLTTSTGSPTSDAVLQAGLGDWLQALLAGIGGWAVGGPAGALVGAGAVLGIGAAEQALTVEPSSTAAGYLSGLGLPEPVPGSFSKTWTTLYERKDGKNVRVYFWMMNDGYIISYDSDTKRSKRWKPKKPIAVVMQGSKMSMNAFLKLDRYLDRFTRRLAKRSKRLKLQ